jgi:hypothetical protein
MESREINLVIDKIVKCMFESAWLQLLFKINSQHYVLTIVIVLEMWHVDSLQDYHATIITEGHRFRSFPTASTPS